MTAVTGSTAYYRDRAICRKIAREGTGLVPDRMTTEALRSRLSAHMAMLVNHVLEADTSSVALARAAWEIEAVYDELWERRYAQLVMLM